jgi:hypothetical protein
MMNTRQWDTDNCNRSVDALANSACYKPAAPLSLTPVRFSMFFPTAGTGDRFPQPRSWGWQGGAGPSCGTAKLMVRS